MSEVKPPRDWRHDAQDMGWPRDTILAIADQVRSFRGAYPITFADVRSAPQCITLEAPGIKCEWLRECAILPVMAQPELHSEKQYRLDSHAASTSHKRDKSTRVVPKAEPVSNNEPKQMGLFQARK